MSSMNIEQKVASLATLSDRSEQVRMIGLFLTELEKGSIRAAVRDDMGVWTAVSWVKEAILTAFRIGILNEYASGSLSFIDKDSIPPRKFRKDDGVRIVPGGTSVRRGTF